MQSINQLVNSRARVRARYAILPLQGYSTSHVPGWDVAELRVLASPSLGAGFVQYLMAWTAGNSARFSADPHLETFIYVIDGSVQLERANRPDATLSPGGFALLPPSIEFILSAPGPARTLLLRKHYQPAATIELFQPLIGNAADVAATGSGDVPQTRVQTLVPDELQYDLSINIFTFYPGFGPSSVETPVMEHGLYILQGKGSYYLDDGWLEIEKDDFIWMGPYCPQSFNADGPTAARYICYKNVNREIGL